MICDVAGLTARIEQVGERCVKGISTAMTHYAEVMVNTAQLMAPRDTGALEAAIHYVATRNGINGRMRIEIMLDSSVMDYAWLMEKYLIPHGKGGGSRWGGSFHARVGTLSKGSRAGGGFLRRAVKAHREALLDKASAIAKREAAKV